MTAETLSHLATTLQATAAALANHLWQSTVFAAVVGLLTLALRSNQARARHWLWMTASLKFLLPFALISGLAAHLEKPRRAQAQTAALYTAVEDFSEPFAEQLTTSPVVAIKPHIAALPLVCAAVWLAGFVTVLGFWSFCWLRIARTMRRARPLAEGREIDALRRIASAAALHRAVQLRVSATTMEPGVFGILRPVLAWPAGLSTRLDDAHLEGILAHEVCHVRRRDNLAAALHMFVEAVFWFYPLTWWIGARLLAERERACDEEVLLLLARPREYAESILKVCEYCVESPLACVSGVTGADLKQRVREIMSARAIHRLTWTRKLLLLATAAGIAWLPIALAQAHATQRLVHAALKSAPAPIRTFAHTLIPIIETPSTGEIAAAQPDATASTATSNFDVASIRPSPDWTGQPGSWMGIRTNPSGRLEVRDESLESLVWFAFANSGSHRAQVTGASGWIGAQKWNIEAKADGVPPAGLSNEERDNRMRPILRTLLEQRFHLKLHTEMRVTAVYALVQVKGGAKLKEVARPADATPEEEDMFHRSGQSTDKPLPGAFTVSGDGWYAHAIRINAILGQVGYFWGVDRMVVDETGLKGVYDFSVKILRDKDSPPPAEQIEDQLGLKLEPRKMPLLTYVIDSAEKPSVDGAEVQGQTAISATSEQADGLANANSNSKPLEYSVVSVRQSQSLGGMALQLSPDSYTAKNVTLWGLMFNAYNLYPGDPPPSLPAWATAEQFDLEAKMDSATVAATQALSGKDREHQLDAMLQTILKQRFGLQVHYETKDRPIYELTLTKDKSKLNRLPDDAPPRGTSWGKDRINVQAGSIEQFVFCLSDVIGHRVVDKTGLQGKYDISLKFAPDDAQGATNEGPSIFTALQEQLGMKLVPTKAPVPVMVVDHIEKPTPN